MEKWNEPQAYAVKHKDKKILEASRSGGIFTALSDIILGQNGVIYGSALTDSFEAAHRRAENSEDRDSMRGSKYIQSNMGTMFSKVKQDLQANKMVMFTGTSCQIAGLKAFLEKEYDNLICVDIVCHGVPSPLVWRKYLEWQSERNSGKIVGVDFRNKTKFGWRAHVETLTLKNNLGKMQTVDSNVFSTIFYGHSILRPSCYKCPYKSVRHPGDITIADYWGIERNVPAFDDNKGVSLVLINNDKGNKLFEKVKDDILWHKTEIVTSMQPPFVEPFPAPKNRDEVWNAVKNKKFDYVAKKYGGWGLSNKIKRFSSRIKRKINKILKHEHK